MISATIILDMTSIGNPNICSALSEVILPETPQIGSVIHLSRGVSIADLRVTGIEYFSGSNKFNINVEFNQTQCGQSVSASSDEKRSLLRSVGFRW